MTRSTAFPQRSSLPRLLTIIPTSGKNIDMLQQCLRTLHRAAEGVSMRSIIVLCPGDAKRADSIRALLHHKEELLILPPPFSFARSNNAALTRARDEKFVLFLNDDCFFRTEHDIARLIETLHGASLACVGPWIRQMNDKDVFFAEKTQGVFQPGSPLIGACMLWKKEWLDRVGAFDENFSGYGGEEVDLLYRTLLQGGRWVRDDHVIVDHRNHATFGAQIIHDEEHRRNLEYWNRKHPGIIAWTEGWPWTLNCSDESLRSSVPTGAMAHFWDTVIRPLLELLETRTIVEIGVEDGKTTWLALEYCHAYGATLHGIDPKPLLDEDTWKQQWGDRFILHRAKSLDIIPSLPPFDAILIDGDHNWYTVYHELMLIEQQSEKHQRFPVVFLHDVDWPYGRRDLYYDPSSIPADARQPHDQRGLDVTSKTLVAEGGLNQGLSHAIAEGNPRNGVRTAIEDFLKEREQRFAFFEVHGFFGLGIVVPRELLEGNPRIGTFLHSLALPPFLERYDALLEQERIQGNAAMQELERMREQLAVAQTTTRNIAAAHTKTMAELSQTQRERDVLETELQQAKKEQEKLLQQALLLYQTIHRMERSRSWRWSAWLRAMFRLLTTHNSRLTSHISSRTTSP